MQDFRNLDVWRKAHELTLRVYQASDAFPAHELYGLRSQLRRSAASIPTNIAEGCGRGGTSDFARFLRAKRSIRSSLSLDLGYLQQVAHEDLTARVQEVKRMLTSLMRRVRADDNKLKTEN